MEGFCLDLSAQAETRYQQGLFVSLSLIMPWGNFFQQASHLMGSNRPDKTCHSRVPALLLIIERYQCYHLALNLSRPFFLLLRVSRIELAKSLSSVYPHICFVTINKDFICKELVRLCISLSQLNRKICWKITTQVILAWTKTVWLVDAVDLDLLVIAPMSSASVFGLIHILHWLTVAFG